jgi:peptide-methionine (S)-S-oxide reductase
MHRNSWYRSPRRWKAAWLCGSILAIAGLAAFSVSHLSADEARAIPAPLVDQVATTQASGNEVAVFAGGCFWGVQGVFQHVKGVKEAMSGYAGGKSEDALYETVGTGTTGHAESVRVTFDPRQISYGRLLQIYFSVAHDPTELNKQGPDHGTQYRSTIFASSIDQQKVAAAYISQLDAAHAFQSKIATTIEMGKTFYPAEGYHQNFLTLNPAYPYIAINDLPKVENLQKLFPDAYRADPMLVAVAKPTN